MGMTEDRERLSRESEASIEQVGGRVPHVGTYTRELPVSIERLYENALDWEHLPWLHSTSFSDIEVVEAGDWGWRAWAGLQPREDGQRVLLELALDRSCRRWITTTLEGPAAGGEVWTHAFAMGERRTDIVVDFFVPGVSASDAPAVGEFYKSLYARLYDEDVWMMSSRQSELDKAAARNGDARDARLVLGAEAEVRSRTPFDVELDGRAFKVAEVDGELVVYPTVCSHMLGPLGEAAVKDGTVECPWHGYRFDVRTGACVSGARCTLQPAPRLGRDDDGGGLVLEW